MGAVSQANIDGRACSRDGQSSEWAYNQRKDAYVGYWEKLVWMYMIPP